MIKAALAATALLSALPAAAQSQLKPFAQVFEDSNSPDSPMMRPVAPAEWPGNWAKPSDYPVEILQARRKGRALLRVSVDTNDKITGCAVRGGTADAELAAVSCAIVRERGTFRHGLTRDGVATGGDVDMVFSWTFQDTSIAEPPPSPPPPPKLPKAWEWPATYISNELRVKRTPDWKAFAPQAKPRTQSEVAVGLLLEGSAILECRPLQSSGDPALDAATCDAARSGSYQGPNGYRTMLPMIVNWRDGQGVARFPLRTYSREGGAIGAATPPGLHAMAGKSHVMLWIDLTTDAKPLTCRIVQTSGIDATDVALCDLALHRLNYRPTVDVFDRSLPGVVPVYFKVEP